MWTCRHLLSRVYYATSPLPGCLRYLAPLDCAQAEREREAFLAQRAQQALQQAAAAERDRAAEEAAAAQHAADLARMREV